MFNSNLNTEKLSWHLTSSLLVVHCGRELLQISDDDVRFCDAIKLLRNEDYSNLIKLLDIKSNVIECLREDFVIRNGMLFYNNELVHDSISNIIIDFYKNQYPIEYLLSFYAKLRKNPSFESIKDLYAYIVANSLTITSNGNMLLYKKVNNDMRDIYSNIFNNNIGKTVEMPRSGVDPDRTNTCSFGLHVASFDYAKNDYGWSSTDIMISVEVDPVDMVAVPLDYNQQKMRVCRYKVVDIINEPIKDKFVKLSEPIIDVLNIINSDHISFFKGDTIYDINVGNKMYSIYEISENCFDEIKMNKFTNIISKSKRPATICFYFKQVANESIEGIYRHYLDKKNKKYVYLVHTGDVKNGRRYYALVEY